MYIQKFTRRFNETTIITFDLSFFISMVLDYIKFAMNPYNFFKFLILFESLLVQNPQMCKCPFVIVNPQLCRYLVFFFNSQLFANAAA